MFLRISKGKTRDYVVIVRGYRDQNGKPKQKTIKNLGSFRTEAEKERYKVSADQTMFDCLIFSKKI